MHGGIYELSHKLFNSNNILTPNRHSLDMNKTLRKQRHCEVLNPEEGSSVPREKVKVNRSRIQAVKTDGGVLVQHGS